jgi:hypothetical protein
MLYSELNCLSKFKEGLGCGRSLVATTPPPYLTLPQRGIEAFPIFRSNMIYTDTVFQKTSQSTEPEVGSDDVDFMAAGLDDLHILAMAAESTVIGTPTPTNNTTVSSGKPLNHRSASLGWVNIVVETHAANKLAYGSGYNVNEKCLQCLSILCSRNTCCQQVGIWVRLQC